MSASRGNIMTNETLGITTSLFLENRTSSINANLHNALFMSHDKQGKLQGAPNVLGPLSLNGMNLSSKHDYLPRLAEWFPTQARLSYGLNLTLQWRHNAPMSAIKSKEAHLWRLMSRSWDTRANPRPSCRIVGVGWLDGRSLTFINVFISLSRSPWDGTWCA